MFTYSHDVLGRKTMVTGKGGSTDDYVNRYAYDTLGRVTRISQAGVSGGNDVAEKRVDLAYSDDGTRWTLTRLADLAGTKFVAETDQAFDQLGRVGAIRHGRTGTQFADRDFAWDAAGRITDFDFTSLVGDDGDADYRYDDTSQLTGADYDFQTDESYTYDDNGNRTDTGYATGDHNRLTNLPPRRRGAEDTTRSPGFSASPRLGGYFPRVAPDRSAGILVGTTLDSSADDTIEESGLSVQRLQGWRDGWLAGNPGWARRIRRLADLGLCCGTVLRFRPYS